MKRVLATTISCFVAIMTAAQAPRITQPLRTEMVECDQHTLTAQTDVIVFSSGATAFLSLRGEVMKQKNAEDTKCRIRWYVHAASSRAAAPNQVEVDVREDDWYYENFFELHGWSRDGSLLLASEIVAAGDWDQTIPLVYEMKTGKVVRIDLEKVFGDRLPKDCLVYFRLEGFSREGDLLVGAGPRETDLPEGQNPCFPESRWKVGKAIPHKVTKAGSDEQAEAYGIVSGATHE